MCTPSCSKSTKRRRFLEQIELVELYADSPEPTLLGLQNNDCLNSQENIEIVLGSPQCTNSDVLNNVNLVQPYCSIVDTSNPPLVFSSSEDEFFISSSDLDSDEYGSKEMESVCDDESVLKMLAQWAITYNITNVALSALLKGLKLHTCCKYIPIDVGQF